MDYKKKYEQALERCKKEFNFNNLAYSHEEIKQRLERVFPELKESEDERVRKEIIEYLEQSQFGEEHYQIDDDIVRGYITWLEMQGNQKSINKGEPKFKVGDWVVYEENIYQIHNISLKKYYECLRIDGTVHSFDFEYIDSKSRLWTIRDAKDGDVLVCEGKISKNKYGQEIGIVKEYVGRVGGCDNCFETYCFIDWECNLIVSKAMGSPNVHPATKEQRDLLFSKMKEAGYEWDAEKKEKIKNV